MNCVVVGELESGELRLIAYPNPFSDGLHLEFNKSVVGSIELLDAMNHCIAVYNVNGSKQTIHLTAYPAGLYFIRLKSNYKLQTLKVIKN